MKIVDPITKPPPSLDLHWNILPPRQFDSDCGHEWMGSSLRGWEGEERHKVQAWSASVNCVYYGVKVSLLAERISGRGAQRSVAGRTRSSQGRARQDRAGQGSAGQGRARKGRSQRPAGRRPPALHAAVRGGTAYSAPRRLPADITFTLRLEQNGSEDASFPLRG